MFLIIDVQFFENKFKTKIDLCTKQTLTKEQRDSTLYRKPILVIGFSNNFKLDA